MKMFVCGVRYPIATTRTHNVRLEYRLEMLIIGKNGMPRINRSAFNISENTEGEKDAHNRNSISV